MSSAKNESLTSSWPVWMPFISLCCLIAEGKTSNTMLNNSDESGHPCLVPDLRGKALSFSPLRMILASLYDDNRHHKTDNIPSLVYGFNNLEV